MLIHPVWQAANAYFVKLELSQEPTADYVAYSFEFWEDTRRYSQAQQSPSQPAAVTPQFHTVVSGESVWSIAEKYSTTVSSIAALNPSLKNINLIYVGQEVRVK